VCLCGRRDLRTVHVYHQPPPGEVRFPFSQGQQYLRRLVQCPGCGHFLSLHHMDMGRLYEQDYVAATYGGLQGLYQTFQRINALPPHRSDNLARVERVHAFCLQRLGRPGRLLDVGSGLCVFPYRMRQRGWQCLALDMDPRQVEHARHNAGVEALCACLEPGLELGRFQLITFNKVLEHVVDPVALLACAHHFLAPGGLIYLELPDGEAAIADPDGPLREEFFIDHHHAFSPRSLQILAERSGFHTLRQQRLREPSGKYTLWAFLEPHPAAAQRMRPNTSP
jgi:SAM-dependent methyltransferase